MSSISADFVQKENALSTFIHNLGSRDLIPSKPQQVTFPGWQSIKAMQACARACEMQIHFLTV